MATIGQFDYPNSYYMWYIEGDDLIIVTTEPEDGSNVRGYTQSPQETITDGILINYLGEPDAITTVTDSLDLDNTLHKYVVEYVKAEMYMMESGKAAMEGNNDRATMLERMSLRHRERWERELKKYGMKNRDKVGGRRRFMPLDYRSSL